MVNSKSHKRIAIFQTLIVLAIVIVANAIGRNIYSYMDLTEDKMFSLTRSTERLVSGLEEVVYIDVLLGDDLPSGYKTLKNRVEELLKQLRAVNPNLEYEFKDPSKGTIAESNSTKEKLAIDGIYPQTLFVIENDQKVEKLIYPYAIIKKGSRQIPINLLEPQGADGNQEVWLNRSATLLEYKFSNTLEKLFRTANPIVLFTKGNGELQNTETATIEQEVGTTVTTGRIDLDSIYKIDREVDVLVVAGPTQPLSERSKFIIDQYVMNGGKVVWLVEPLAVNIDSINLRGMYVPRPTELGLDDMFFKYGVRFNNELILDLNNSKIPQVIGQSGGKPQYELFPWVYYPLLQSGSEHPIVSKLDPVYSEFPGTIELLEANSEQKQTTLLTSSNNSRTQRYPMRLTFDAVRVEQRPQAYNKSNLPVAVMIEGSFESFYKNRVSKEMEDGLAAIDEKFVEKSKPTTQVFISDVAILRNYYNAATGQISNLGFNRWEGHVYPGNMEFAINLLDYLTDEYGLLEARSKTFQMRLLDRTRYKQESMKWQLINVLGPILLVILGGFFYNYFRRRKYSS